ncbi:septum formation family protein [Nocardia abscessus]|uniref:Septum formation family protein n=1 Tax=Nocardia abscessus TaxID=120957 RepID=A0ABS0C2T6_9NOCA|nr:septum formation family protein [Nocardia abscessus]MBF6223773.1 septum formation family protein [Nocardia abscessus]
MSSEHVSRFPKAPKRGASSRADAVRRSFDSAKAALAESELRDVRLSARTLRWGLLAVAVGAVVAAMVTLFVTGFDNETGLEAHNPGSPAQPVLDKEFGTAAKGDCLSWTKPDRSDLVKVNCASKHMFEVAADIDMSRYPGKEFGPGSRFPDSLRLTELKEEHCVPAVQKYMSGRFDPRGKYIVGLMYPSPDGWQHGDRTLRCGLQVAASVGTPPSVGSATEHDQSRVYEPGVCLGINQNLPTDPVDCAQPHAVEIVATVDLGTHFTGGPPAKEEQDKFVEEECSRTSTEYLGAPDVIRNKTLTLFFDYIDARSWMAGSRKLDCMIGKGADREGFAPITGSAKGDILINGQAPVPPPNSGRSTPAPLPGAAPLPPQPQPR